MGESGVRSQSVPRRSGGQQVLSRDVKHGYSRRLHPLEENTGRERRDSLGRPYPQGRKLRDPADPGAIC